MLTIEKNTKWFYDKFIVPFCRKITDRRKIEAFDKFTPQYSLFKHLLPLIEEYYLAPLSFHSLALFVDVAEDLYMGEESVFHMVFSWLERVELNSVEDFRRVLAICHFLYLKPYPTLQSIMMKVPIPRILTRDARESYENIKNLRFFRRDAGFLEKIYREKTTIDERFLFTLTLLYHRRNFPFEATLYFCGMFANKDFPKKVPAVLYFLGKCFDKQGFFETKRVESEDPRSRFYEVHVFLDEKMFYYLYNFQKFITEAYYSLKIPQIELYFLKSLADMVTKKEDLEKLMPALSLFSAHVVKIANTPKFASTIHALARFVEKLADSNLSPSQKISRAVGFLIALTTV